MLEKVGYKDGGGRDSNGVKYLIDLDDHEGTTAFSEACMSGDTECVEYFIEKQAHLDAACDKGKTALFRVAYNRMPEVVKMLLEAG